MDFKNFKNFLTPETEAYYEQALEVVKSLEDISGAKVVIFGGFIRSLIAGEGRPRDVDLWFTYQRPEFAGTPGIWRRRIGQMLLQLQTKYSVSVKHLSTVNDTRGDDKYEIATINIDGFDYDFCCNTSERVSFDTLADFSVNNLYMGTDGVLKTRVKTNFTVQEIIHHIQNRLLLHINDAEAEALILKKSNKMIELGYRFQ